MPADPAARRLHLWTALILLGVFLSGAAAGAGLAHFLRPPPRPAGPPGRGGMLPPPLVELGLSPEQAEKARAIFERHRPELEAAIQDSFPRVRAIQERAEAEVRALLTPEQAARFDAVRARRPPFPGMGHGMGPPGPGPRGMEPPGPPAGEPPPGEPPPPRR
jgi:Spy/CpxP family protein refolding chaperone